MTLPHKKKFSQSESTMNQKVNPTSNHHIWLSLMVTPLGMVEESSSDKVMSHLVTPTCQPLDSHQGTLTISTLCWLLMTLPPLIPSASIRWAMLEFTGWDWLEMKGKWHRSWLGYKHMGELYMQLHYIYILHRCLVPCADHLIHGACICGHIIQQAKLSLPHST